MIYAHKSSMVLDVETADMSGFSLDVMSVWPVSKEIGTPTPRQGVHTRPHTHPSGARGFLRFPIRKIRTRKQETQEEHPSPGPREAQPCPDLRNTGFRVGLCPVFYKMKPLFDRMGFNPRDCALKTVPGLGVRSASGGCSS
jgi:hypothetical protein